MKMITNFLEANQRLAEFYNNATTKYTLDTMLALMDFLDNPQEKFKIIHVAGTSGKTSTAYYAAALLTAAGYKTGLTVSPHVDEINERVQINMQPLPETEFCTALSEFLALLDKSPVTPSWFELMVAFAYWSFAQQKVDYAVIEVGLGGLLDGTNVIARADKLCIITDIGLDHTQILGNTLAEIATQKAGIIQPHNHLFLYRQGKSVMDTIMQVVAAKDAEATVIETQVLSEGHMPLFQQRNFYLAEKAIAYVLQRDGALLTDAQKDRARTAYVPGRMEIINYRGKTIILDGAHNAQKLNMLKSSITHEFGNPKIAVLIGFVESDEQRITSALSVLSGLADYYVATSFVSAKDYIKHSVNPQVIADSCPNLTVQVEPDVTKAFKVLLARPEPVLLVTGSFYLLNHIRPLMLKES